MPLYEYETLERGCAHCRGGFELLQSFDDAPLERCPECGARCRRLISAPNVSTRPRDVLSEQNLSAKGFSQYRKDKPGVYRKTAGRGPDTIKR